jgi:hypothetical protein
MNASTLLSSVTLRCCAGCRVAALICLALMPAYPLRAQSAAPESRTLDNFENPALWKAVASDGVRAGISGADAVPGRALRLDFDFAGAAGYAIARRDLPLDLPENYEISFDVRGEAPVNNLEFKLIDASGENVWWSNRRDFEFGKDWQHIRIKKRQIEFAWGPTADRTLHHVASIELVVSAGHGGGGGSVYFSGLSLRQLPGETEPLPPPRISASSFLPGSEAELALDGKPATAWQSDPAAGPGQRLTIDFGRAREFGGLVLQWSEQAFASRYDVDISDDAVRWRTVRRVIDGNGGRDPLMLGDAEARYLRLVIYDGPLLHYSLAEIEIRDPSFGASPNAFFQALAREAQRGLYPRGFSGEQPYWTLVGVDGGSDSGLLSEDGALEVAKGGFSIEPFVINDTHLSTWADVDVRQSLQADYLPIPSVVWQQPQWELRTTAFAAGSAAQSQLVARYELVNHSEQPLSLRLVLAVRPFQVNSPAQFLNTPGGVSAIRELRWNGQALTVNGERQVIPLSPPDQAGVSSFDTNAIPIDIAAQKWKPASELHDTFGYASAAFVYRVELAPHASAVIGLVVPLTGQPTAPQLGELSPQAWMDSQQTEVAESWRKKLNEVVITAPAAAQPLVDSLRTALAHILITRDGAALRPGTRAYARSWIRDGAMMSEGLLRLGQDQVVADYLRWYAPRQFADGKVPCCVDGRGADPVPENDSHGELIFLAAQAFRYSHDRALLQSVWPNVEAAARYIETLRQSERTVANRSAERRAFYGLMPASISHEGYSAKPMHSYWDDFWTLRGLGDAVMLAGVLDHRDAVDRLTLQRDDFRHDLFDSLRASTAAHGIDFLPGCAELGDFDPTSTTIALSPGGEQTALPQDQLHATFERYWREFVERRDGLRKWEDYTPYEWRTVGSFVRLGWRERSQQLISFFMADRRPTAWNQWPEVIGREPRQPRFLGDLPHGWVASDFIRSALDLFAYERESDGALVLAAGVPQSWLDGHGIAVKNLRTPYGPLSYSLRRTPDKQIVLEVAKGSGVPPGGFVFPWPEREAPRSLRVNGRAAPLDAGEARIGTAPGRLVAEER